MNSSVKNFFLTTSVFFIFLSIFFLWHASLPHFTTNDDPYYHARWSAIIAERNAWGATEPWIAYHFLSESPVDPYFLAHFLTAKLIKAFGVIWGVKILSALQAAAVFAVFFWLAKSAKIQRPFLWTILLGISSAAFTSRLLFERPFVLSIAFLLLTYECVRRKNYLWLTLLTILYTLYYNLAPLGLSIALVSILVDWRRKEAINLKPLIAISLGLAIGILIVPHSLNYLSLMFVQFWDQGWLKLQGINLPSGREIMPQSGLMILGNNALLILFQISALAIFFFLYKERKINWELQMLCLISTIWFVVGVMIPRGVEYWAPFGCLFAGLAITTLSKEGYWREMVKKIDTVVAWPILRAISIAAIVLLSIGRMNTALLSLRTVYQKDAKLADYKGASDYLMAATEKQSIIFHPDWGIFPRLFFFNTHNRYMSGFDPIFLYEYNREMYWLWYNITYRAEYCNHALKCPELPGDKNTLAIALTIRAVFDSSYIITLRTPTTTFGKFLDEEPEYFRRAYRNNTLSVYEVTLPRDN
ncbi:MAG: hypothetical protein AAB408_01245 [Patescibacteria group bacterium]